MGKPRTTSQRAFQSWGRYPKSEPARIIEIRDQVGLPDFGDGTSTVLAYGQGRSYGDVCLNNGGTLLSTAALDRFIHFDADTGLLRAEAGTTLADILALIVPRGWFLPVSPGTKFVSLGGAVANDIHGKNHHVAGTFGRHVTQFELVRSSGERLICSPECHAELLGATIAGLGLTGFITWVELQLKRIESDQIDLTTARFRSLDEFLSLSEKANEESPYVVAWLDGLRAEGRGLLMQGDHAPCGPRASLPVARAGRPPRLFAPFDAPEWLLNPLSIRAFNTAYFHRQIAGVKRSRVHYDPYFYPLDAVRDWNRGYGKRGLLQYQCVIPFDDLNVAVRELLKRIAASGASSFLSVIKTFGTIPSPGLMSFPRPGITLSLDFANKGERTIRLLHSLDAIVRDAGGAVYPAKDACMTGESFRAYFPNWEEFSAYIDPAFSSSFWRRVTS